MARINILNLAAFLSFIIPILSACTFDFLTPLVTAPAPLRWLDFTVGNQISVGWDAIPGASSYVVQWKDKTAATFTSGSITVTSTAIQCPAKDGSPMHVSYQYQTSTETSPLSIPMTFLFPGAPSMPVLVSADPTRIIVSWAPPADIGGTPITGYQLYMKKPTEPDFQLVYDGKNSPATKITTITSYNEAPLEKTTYNFKINAFNWVGKSPDSPTLSFSVQSPTSATTSVVSGPGISTITALVSTTFTVQAKDDTGTARTTGGDLFFLRVTDVCRSTSSFKCVRVPTTDPHYVPDIVPDPIVAPLQDNDDGTYTGIYKVNAKGFATLSVYLMTSGGLYGEYFENIWFDGAPAISRVDPVLDFDWGNGLITNYAADFVSTRWVGKVKAPTTEKYMFTVEADDGFRLYLDNKLLIDGWDKGPGSISAEYDLVEDSYYDIVVEYVEYQGTARLKLYWSTLSIPKAIIPSQYLWSPKNVGLSPYEVTVLQGSTVPSLSYATGSGLRNAVAGKLQTFKIQSVDINGAPQDSQNDHYSVQLIGPLPDTSTVQISTTATYSSLGLYEVQYVPIIAGTYSLAITLEGVNIKDSPFALEVAAGDIDPTKCVVDLPALPSMTAGATMFFDITAKDIYGNTITSGGLTDIAILADYLNSDSFASPIGAPDLPDWAAIYGTDISGAYKDLGNGKYTGQITVFRAGSFSLKITINSASISGTPLPLTVHPAQINGEKCVAVGFSSTATAGTAQTFQIQARDYYSNNIATLISSVSDKKVEVWSADLTKLVVTGSLNDVAGSPGAYSASYTVNTAGTYKVLVRISGQNITASPFSLTVSAGSTTNPPSSTITGLTKNFVAGETLTFLIEARDSFGNLRSSASTDVFNVKLTGSSTNINLTPVAQNNGTYLATTTLIAADTYTLTVDIGGVAIKDTPVTGIQVQPNIAQAEKSALILNPSPIVVGTLTKYKILPKDVYGNVVRQTGLSYYLELRNEVTKELTEVVAAYNIDGYDASFTLTKAADYSAVIKLAQHGGLRATYYRTVDFMNPVELLTMNVHSGQLPNKYTRIDPTVNFKWGIDSPGVVAGYPSDFFSVRWEGKLKTTYSEYYKFTVATDNTVRLKINGEVIIDNISPGGTMNPSSEYSAYYTLTSGVFYDIVLEYVETRGSSQIQLFWQSDSIPKQIIPSENLYNVLYSDTTPFSLTANPAAIDPEYCTLSKDYDKAVVGVPKTVVIQARDRYSNLQLGNHDTFTVSLTNTDGDIVSGTVTATSDGTYTATFTLLFAGTYQLQVLVKPSGTGTALEIAGSPFTVTCATSSTDPSKTTVSGTGISSATAGVVATFTISTKDTNGNARTAGGDTIDISLTNGFSTLTYNSIQILDQNNGNYDVQYVITDASADYTLKVTVNGDTENAIIKTVTALPGSPDPLKSTISKSGYVEIDTPDTFSIIAKDAYGNVVSNGVSLVSKISGAFGEKYFTGTLSAPDQGKYDTSFTITSGPQTVCGSYYVYGYFLQPGIRGTYYSNIWLTGEYAMQRIDKSISFNWGLGEIIPGIASDYVGIEWKGYIKPTTSEAYTFYVTCNDGVRVYINNQLVIDNYVTVTQGKLVIDQTTPISLSAGQFYPIRIQYFEQSSDASIILEWKTGTIQRQVIPEAAFYSNILDTPVGGAGYLLDVKGKPGVVSDFKQGGPSTYSTNSIQLTWFPPEDTGCSTISSYKIEQEILGTWNELSTTSSLFYNHGGLTAGVSQTYRITASNAIGSGTSSTPLTLVPGILPSAPATINIVAYGENFITLSWPQPTNTGYGDTTAPILSYLLEVNDGFNNEFVTLSEQDSTQYMHQGVMLGHSYKYRVKAKNYLGYGGYSPTVSAVPKRVPGKPSNPPSNIPSQTTASVIYISYDLIRDNGGSEILYYKVYMDDGLGGAYGTPVNNNLQLAYNTGALSLISGRTYRFKYSGVNSEGEGPTSEEVSILSAAKPGAPGALVRVVNSTINAGYVVVRWNAPSDTGGIAISGYKIYLDDIIYSDGIAPTVTSGVITQLTVGMSYKISVSALNPIGEGPAASITVVAAGVPSRMSAPRIKSSTPTTIEVEWDPPSFNGGSAVTSYLIQRDDGPNTGFLSAEAVTANSYTFTSLPAGKFYFRILVSAVNAIGQGDPSPLATFVAASTPGAPQNFEVTLQSATEIGLSWDPPSATGGCSVEGYMLYMESVDSPGFSLIFDGRTSSHVTTYAVIRPTIIPAKSYRFALQSKNCGYFSSNITLTATAAGVPSAPTSVIMQKTVSATSAIIAWSVPIDNGGVPIISYKVYQDNTLTATISGSSSTSYTLTGLNLGNTYKITVSAVNSVGESDKSIPFYLLFANPPSVPTNLVLTGTESSITVSWQAPSSFNGDPVRGYKVYMDDGKGGPLTLAYDGRNYPQTLKVYIFALKNINRKLIDDVKAGLRYNIEVKAINVAGESISAVGHVIAGNKPSPPYGLKILSIYPNENITISWKVPLSSGGLPITGYTLNKDDADLSASIDPTDTEYTDDISTGGAIGTKITYKIKSTNAAGDSDYSEPFIAQIGTLPNPPQNLVLAGHPSNSSISLKWSAETTISSNFPTLGYRVYNKETSALLFDGTNSAIVLQATISGLITGNTYSLVVRSVNALGESLDSNTLSAITGLPPSKMAAPTLDASTTTSIKIKWVEPMSNGGLVLTGYKIYIDVGQTGTFTANTIGDTSVRTFLKDSLVKGTKVDFKVSAVNGVNEGPISDVSTFISAVVPTAPTILTLVRSYLEDQTYASLEVRWVEPPDGGSPITGYKLYMSRSDESSFTKIFDGTNRPDITNYVSKGLLIGYTYNFKMTAINAVGESLYSPILSVIAAATPTQPLNLGVVSSKAGAVTLSWDAPNSSGGLLITKYTMYYSVDSTSYSWTSVTGIPASTLTKEITGLVIDTIYAFKVTASNDLGEGESSGIISQFASDVPTGLSDLSIISGSRTLTSVGVSWGPPTSSVPITGYMLYMDNGAGSDIENVVYDGKNNPSKTKAYVTNLKTGATYKFSYVAYNAAGRSQSSLTLTVTIGLFPDPPAAPPTLTSCSPTAISFKWVPTGNTNGASLTGYKVYVNDIATDTVTGSTLTYTLTSGIVAGNSYKVQISAVNLIGEGSKSQSNVFYAVEVPSAPSLSIAETQTDSCTISWTAVTPPANTAITGYSIFYDTMQGNGYQTACDFTNNPSQLSCKVQNLQTGAKVAVKAVAYNKAGKSVDSTAIYCTPVGKPGQPGTPRLVTSSSSSIKIQWDGAAATGGLPITGYKLYSDEEEVAPDTPVESWVLVYEGPGLSATMSTGITAGRSYRFKVQAVNSANQGLFSNVASYLAASVPPTPDSFAVAASSRTWLYLTWTKPTPTAGTDPPCSGYIITTDYGDSPSFTILANITNGDQLAFNVTGQPTGSTYRFRLSAYNLVGRSAETANLEGTFADLPGKMQTPYYVSSSKTGDTTANLKIGWEPAGDTGGVPLTGYKLYMTDTVTSTGGVVYDGSGKPATLEYTATSLVLGRKYRFYVTALNPKEGPASNSVDFYAATLPGKITTIAEVANSRTESCIGLEWAPPDNGGSSLVLYEVFTDDNKLRYSGSTPKAYICGLNTGQNYRFIVTATSNVGKGPDSDPFKVLIAGVPTAPRYLRTTSVASNAVSLAWEVPSSLGGAPLTGFKVYRKESTAVSYAVLATLQASLVTYTDSTVIVGKEYTYAISSTNAIGESAVSESIDVIAMNPPSQPAPPVMIAKDRYSIRIGWSAPNANGGSIQEYKVFLKKQGDTDYSLVYIGSGTEYLAAGLSSGVTYYFKISAKNAAGESSLSDPSAGILTSEKPLPPSNIRVTSRSSGSITLQWDLPSDTGGVPLVGYVVESAKGSADYAEVSFDGNTNPGVTTLSHTGLTACELYSYKIYSVNVDGKGLPSTPISVISASLPSAPTNPPTIASVSRYSATVTLTAPDDNGGCPITYYKVYISTNGGPFIEVASTPSTTVALSGLQISSTYHIKYAASNRVFDEFNMFTTTLLMSPAAILTVAVPPQPPENFRKGSMEYRDSVYLEWNFPLDTGGSSITGYSLEIVDTVSSTTSSSELSEGSTSYVATGLVPGRNYAFRMSTKTAAGDSPFTNDVNVVPGLFPIRPTGLSIGTKTRSGFTATWTALTAEDTGGTAANPIAISTYEVLVRDLAFGTSNTYTTTSSSYKLTYLVPGNMYGVKLRACTVIGCGEYSAEVKEVAGLVPDIPYDLKLMKQSSNQIELVWQEPSDDGGSNIMGYQVGVQVDGVETLKTGIFTNSYKFTTNDGLTAGKTYLFRVAAQNANGYGAWTSQATGYSSNLPNAVSGLTASSITQYSVQISWTLLSTAESKGYSTSDPTYVLESANCLDNTYSVIYTTTSANTYTVSGVTPGTCAKYRMKVSNNVGSSLYCTPVEVLFAVAPSAPSIPSLVRRDSNPDGTFIQLSWLPPATKGGSPILGYILEQYSSSTWATVYDGSMNPSVLSYTSRALTPGETYKFRVSARNSAGTSAPSSELTVIAGTVPSKVSNLRVTSKTVSGSTSSFVLTWDLPLTGGSPITNHFVKYKVASSSSAELIVPSGSATNTFTLSTLNAGVTYTISIAASNAVYDSNNLEGLSLAYSSKLTAVMADTPAKITTLIQSPSTTSSQIILSWGAPSDGGSTITKYTLYKDNGAGVYYALYTGPQSTYTDTAVIEGNSYTYKVLATNDAGDGLASDPVMLKAGTKPSTVKNLRVTAQSKTSLTVSWDAPETLGGFPIMNYWVLSDNGDMTFTPPHDNGLTLSYTKSVTGAQIGLTFLFKVAAENVIGMSEYSEELSIIAASPPDAPTLVEEESSRTKTSVVVKWDQPASNGGSPIIGYMIRRDDGIAGSAFTIVYNGNNLPQAFSYKLTDLVPGRTYTVKISAVNLVGESTTPTTITLVAGTKPARITAVNLVSSSSTGKIKVSWSAPSDTGGLSLTKYKLHIAEVGQAFGAPIEHTDLVTLDYEFTGLTGGETYAISVASLNVIGESDLSVPVEYPAADLPCAPSSPTLSFSTEYFLSLPNTRRTSLLIQWSTPSCTGGSAITAYLVYLNDGQSSSWNTVNCRPALTSSPSCSITGLTTGSSYSIKVTAVNGVGEGPASPVFSTLAAVSPQSPSQPTLLASAKDSVTIAWTPPTDDGGSPLLQYEVYGKLASEASWSLLGTVDADVLSFENTGIATSGVWMQYKVRCKSSFGYSEYSAVSSFVVAEPPTMSAPTLVSATKTSITVTWSAADNGGAPITGYILSQADNNDGVYSVVYDGTGISSVTSFTSSAVIGHKYKFKVMGVNAAGKGPASPESALFLAAVVPSAPAPPIYLSSTDTTIQIQFGAISDDGGSPIIKTNLYMTTLGSSSFTKVTEYNGLDSSYILDKAVITTLVTGTTYQFYTTVENEAGESPGSDILVAAMGNLPSAMAAPTVDYASSTGDTLQISWTAGNSPDLPITGYQLFMHNSPEQLIYDGRSNPTTRTFTVTGLTKGIQYYFYVVAFNVNGAGPKSNEISAYACTAPSAPNRPTLVSSTVNSLFLQWTSPGTDGGCPLIQYRLYVNDGSGGAPTTEVSPNDFLSNPALLSYNVESLSLTGNTYKFKLRAENAVGYSESSIAEFVLASVPLKPAVLTYDSAESTANSIKLLFPNIPDSNNGGSAITGLELQRAVYESSTYTTILTIVGTIANYADTSSILTKGTSYKYRYRVSNVNGWSEYSDDLTAVAGGVPGKPQAPIVTNLDSGQITLQVPSPADNGGLQVTQMDLEKGAGVVNPTFSVAKSGAADSVYTLSSTDGITAGQIYSFRCRAKNSAGYGPYSDVIIVGAGTVPQVPTGVSTDVTKNTANSVYVSWDAATSELPITGYTVSLKVSTSPDSSYSVVYDGSNNPSQTFTSVTGLTTGETYSLFVTASNVNGKSSSSTVLSVNACGVPSAPSAPIVSSTDQTGITISWDIPSNTGGCPLTGFDVYLYDTSSGNYVKVNSLSDSDPTMQTFKCDTTNCLSAGATLGTKYLFKVRTKNSAPSSSSDSAPSMPLLYADVPANPASAPTNVQSGTSTTQITVQYQEITDSKGSPITAYEVQMAPQSGVLTFTTVQNSLSFTAKVTSGITSGQTYVFRYRALNAIGSSDWSPTVSILAATVPNKMQPPTVTLSGSSLRFGWIAANANGSPITEYKLQIFNKGTAAYQDSPCDGTSATVIANQYCDVTPNTLKSTYGYSDLDIPSAKIAAKNAIGLGEYSGPSTGGNMIPTVPSKPPAPIKDPSGTIGQTIQINITPLTGSAQTGGTSIDSYTIQWDQGTNSWVDLQTSLLLTYTKTGLTLSNTYAFRYKANNIMGSSELSDPITIKAVDIPGKITTISADYLATDNTKVELTWIAPAANGGTISAYRVITNGATEAVTTNSYCAEGILPTTKCTVPMSSFWATPFELTTAGDPLEMKVQAYNEAGWGPLSDIASGGVVINTKPLAPPIAPWNDPTTTSSQLVVNWAALTTEQNGGSSITRYSVLWDDGAGSDPSIEIYSGSSTTHTITTGITPGVTYKFKYAGENLFGLGPYSTVTDIRVPATNPTAPSAPTTVLEGEFVKICWGLPSYDGGSAITDYNVYVRDGTDSTYKQNANICQDVDLNTRCCSADKLELASAFALNSGDEVKAKVEAVNADGLVSPQSDETINGCII